MIVHAIALHTPPQDPVAVAVLGPPRQLPEAKDSAWVTTRAPLERAKPPGVSEALLATARGALVEGLVTNLFVVVRGDPGGASGGDGDDGEGEGVSVHTAPAGGEDGRGMAVQVDIRLTLG